MKSYKTIILAMITGLVAGLVAPSMYPLIAPLGTLLLRLLKLIMVPLVFVSLICGTASLSQSTQARSQTKRLILYVILFSSMAALTGVLGALIFKPGYVIAKTGITAAANSPISLAAPPEWHHLLSQIVPSNAIAALQNANLLGIIFMGVLIGTALGQLEPSRDDSPLTQVLNRFNDVIMRITQWIIAVSPVGIFSLTMGLAVNQGLAILMPLFYYIAVVILSLAVFSLVILPLCLWRTLSPLLLAKKLATALLTAFTTASSSSVLPLVINAFQDNPSRHRLAQIIMPIGTTVNMNGTAVYLGVTTVFLSQYYAVTLAPYQYGVIIALSVISAVSAAGIPSASLITMGMILTSVGIPIEGIGLILAIDRLLDMARTTVNVWGNSVITVLLDR